jgi:hypothetical protein
MILLPSMKLQIVGGCPYLRYRERANERLSNTGPQLVDFTLREWIEWHSRRRDGALLIYARVLGKLYRLFPSLVTSSTLKIFMGLIW